MNSMQRFRREAKLRKNKDFETADKIRNELVELGIELQDTIDGTIYRASKIRTY